MEGYRYSGSMISIFRRIGCIGDSLSSGEFEYDAGDGSKGYWDCYEYSWGKQIERLTGVSVTNYSRGGLTAQQLYLDADTKTSPIRDINELFDPQHAKQAYIIALGYNDLKGKDVLKNVYGGQIGCAQTDICLENYQNNSQTVVGAYARIIQRLQEIQPDAKFFLMTMPKEPENLQMGADFAAALTGIAEKLWNCYVLDLYHNMPVHDEAFRKKYFCGHMNAAGYLVTAWQVMELVDRIIEENPEEFRYVQFIGSPYRPYEE